MFCACEDTTPLKFGGVVLLYSEFLSALHLFLLCVM